MRTGRILLLLLLVLLVAFVIASIFILNETQQAIITQFGKPVGQPVTQAGIHFKIPFIQKVNYFEKRILAWDGYPTQIPTKDKKYIWMDTTARWEIADPLKFFQTVVNEEGAQVRLDDIIDGAVRDVVTSHNLIEIVRSSNRIVEEFKKRKNKGSEEKAPESIKEGRDKMREEIIKIIKQTLPHYGIELIDIRIKRVNYVEEVRRKVYERMIAERRQAAEKYRSQGRGIKAEIEGRTEKELRMIISQAYKKAQKIKGEAEAKANQIYSQAYSQDPGFFSFLKTLKTYQNTVDKNTTFLLSTDSDYFKYLKRFQQENFPK